MELILVSLISYLLGSVPFSYIAGRFYGKNLFEIGSRNIGVANVYRATGKAEAVIFALVGDVGKGALAVLLAQNFICPAPNFIIGQAAAAFFVVAGHNWPIFLKFKGGRGLASIVGVLLALNWKTIPLVLIAVGFFIILTELVMKKGIKLKGTFKEKIKDLLSIFISQVAGRVVGMLAAAVLVYIFFPQVFKIVLGAVVLTGIKHFRRTRSFLKEKK